jgi:histidine triad (HIT) family protein
MEPDPECIFCKIVAGEIPCAKVMEDQSALAFLDIGPLAEGHVLLIPKEHYEFVDQMPVDLAAAVLRHIPLLVKAVRSATGCKGVNVLQNNGRAAHQFVPHVHVHIIPRKSGDEFHFNWPAGTYPPGRAEQLVRAIQQNL